MTAQPEPPPGARRLVRADGAVVVPPEIAGELLRFLTVGLTERVRADGGEVSRSARRVLYALHTAAVRADQQPAFVSETRAAPSGSVELTAQQVADILGCSPQYARSLVRTGQLHGRRAGRAWLIDPNSLDRYRTGINT